MVFLVRVITLKQLETLLDRMTVILAKVVLKGTIAFLVISNQVIQLEHSFQDSLRYVTLYLIVHSLLLF